MGLYPDLPPRCKWGKFADPALSPHNFREWPLERQKVYDDVLSFIGHTPLVKLQKIPERLGVTCNIYAKCEYLNPGGSLKDRVALRMVEDAEKSGKLEPDTTIIEPTVGGTGISLALVCSLKGYKFMPVMNSKVSKEKMALMRGLNANVIVVPDTECIFEKTLQLLVEVPYSITLDQYTNPSAPLAHYDATAEEIFDSLDGKVDMLVAASGTGATLTGLARKMKEKNPEVLIIGVDPLGSGIAQPAYQNRTDVSDYEVDGIGNKFVPTSLDRNVVDKWIKTDDNRSFVMARKLIHEEGLLCGGSAGAAVEAAIIAAKDLEPEKNVVVILPDSIRYYLSRFAKKEWMEARHFNYCINSKLRWWWQIDLKCLMKKENMPSVLMCATCHKALHVMQKSNGDVLPVVCEHGWIKTDDNRSFVMARKLIHEEGLLCGGSAGAAVEAAIIAAKDLEPEKNVVVILPDSIRYYLSRFAKKEWMEARHFNYCINSKLRWWWQIDLKCLMKKENMPSVLMCATCHKALHVMQKSNGDVLPVVCEHGNLKGVVHKQKLTMDLVLGMITKNDKVEKTVLTTDFGKCERSSNLGVVFRVLQHNSSCIVYDKVRIESGICVEKPVGIITVFDLLYFLANHPDTLKYGAF